MLQDKANEKINNIKSKVTNVVVLFCSLLILIIYTFDIKDDYYFFTTGKKANASIEQIKKVKEYKPYHLLLSYSNENTGVQEKCALKLNGKHGTKLVEENLNTVGVIYTKQSSCDVYLVDYKVPTKAGLVIHIVLFLISLLALILFTKRLFTNTNKE